MHQYDEKLASDAAWCFLRSNTTASLKFGENTCDVSYIITPDGRLVISAMVAMLQPCDTVMYVPDYSDECMELHISLEQYEASGEEGTFADRWQVYHGNPPDVRWAFVDIDAARYHGMFIDGETLCRINPFASEEFSLCKICNEHKREIARVCYAATNVDVTDPVVVGVDPLGVDVRAPFGIVRISVDPPFTSKEDVISRLELM